MEDHGIATFEFENGARVLLDGGKRFGPPDRDGVEHAPVMTVVGTQGVIYVRDGDFKLDVLTESGKELIIEKSKVDLWVAYCKGLRDWLEGGDCPLTGWDRVRGTSEANLAAYVSMIRGDRVDLPFDEEALQIDEWPVEILARRGRA